MVENLNQQTPTNAIIGGSLERLYCEVSASKSSENKQLVINCDKFSVKHASTFFFLYYFIDQETSPIAPTSPPVMTRQRV